MARPPTETTLHNKSDRGPEKALSMLKMQKMTRKGIWNEPGLHQSTPRHINEKRNESIRLLLPFEGLGTKTAAKESYIIQGLSRKCSIRSMHTRYLSSTKQSFIYLQ